MDNSIEVLTQHAAVLKANFGIKNKTAIILMPLYKSVVWPYLGYHVWFWLLTPQNGGWLRSSQVFVTLPSCSAWDHAWKVCPLFLMFLFCSDLG